MFGFIQFWLNQVDENGHEQKTFPIGTLNDKHLSLSPPTPQDF